jgi:hypothetical protein
LTQYFYCYRGTCRERVLETDGTDLFLFQSQTNGLVVEELSPFVLMACATGFGAAGCDGGESSVAYEYAKSAGVVTGAAFGDGACSLFEIFPTVYRPVRDYLPCTTGNSFGVLAALTNVSQVHCLRNTSYEYGPKD